MLIYLYVPMLKFKMSRCHNKISKYAATVFKFTNSSETFDPLSSKSFETFSKMCRAASHKRISLTMWNVAVVSNHRLL